MDNIDKISAKFSAEIKSTALLSQLEDLRLKYLGRKGIINSILETIKNFPKEKRRSVGQKINNLKTLISDKINRKEKELLNHESQQEYVDITLPGKEYPKGSLHIVTYAIEEISAIFQKIGFIRMTYPEVEWEYYSFDALNMPKGHPARDDFETFFVDAPPHPKFGKMLLSPHTSSGQVREMLRAKKPPIRMINIAKCYRPNWDASHVPMFHQFEGMAIDKNVNITHLKGTIDYFAKEFFGQNREIRLRPAHFQFTEPSFEPDITCGVCLGTGRVDGLKCKICKSGWLELAGSGMIHPNVLESGGIDPEEYSGWAFGFGIERVAMMKEGMKLDDMRLLYSNDIRFLEQF